MKLTNKLIRNVRNSLRNCNTSKQSHPNEMSVVNEHGNIDISVSVRTNEYGNLYRITNYVVRDKNADLILDNAADAVGRTVQQTSAECDRVTQRGKQAPSFSMSLSGAF